ncbi:MAG: UvrD-helicase domain-containing protein [Candidatus Zixiibacteriota bacterium]
MDWLLDDLNPAQREAVLTTDGPLLVIAGAGSGKTRVLTRRLAYLLMQRKAEPYQILAVTFTNKAAGEMRERVNKLMQTEIPELQVSTFHSFCARFLRREAASLGYDSQFTIFDEDDALTLVRNSIKELGINDSQFPAKGQLRKISDAKNALVSAEDFASRAQGYFESRTAAIYSLYQKRLRECDGMDFDDLLFNTVSILEHNTEIGDKYRRRFRYLLVDEYQDTNHVQYLMLKHLLGEHQNICVVGDEDQSIYGWRGADIRNILEFEKDFPGAKIIKLEQNYRSTSKILAAASSVIKNNIARKGKTLWTEGEPGELIQLILVDSAEDEAVRIVDQIAANQTRTALKNTVILYRTNAQSRPFEEQLRRQNLPYQIVGGIGFYQRKEIKDILAYLKLIVNVKDDVSFERVINYPKRGIGDKTVSEIAAIARREGKSSYEVVLSGSHYPELAGKIRRIEPFVSLVESYRQRAQSVSPEILIEDLVTELKIIEDVMSEDKIIGQTKVENIEAFIEGAAEYTYDNSEARLVEYLADISLFTDLDNYREIEDKVTMMTLHSAKGLEFDTVYLVGLEEGLFPLQRTLTEAMQLEEERRLFYVGATRARRYLNLSCARTRFRFGEVESVPSRFIAEMPKELLESHDFRRPSAWAAYGAPATVSTNTARTGSGNGERYYEYEENETFKVGRLVSHPTFGRGKIVSAEGFGDSLRLEIMFTGIGLKKIMAKFAKLKVVG